MMKRIHSLTLMLVLLIGSLLTSCRTDFDVYAPEKEYRVVYCVLDPADSVQYVRIGNAFQFEGDALVFAAENDLSLSGESVRLTDENGNVWTAVEVPNYPKDSGTFIPSQTIYKFTTDGSSSENAPLEHEMTYRLEIGTEEAEDYVTGLTIIPELPQIRGSLNIFSGAGTTQCLPRLSLDRNLNFYWRKLADNIQYEARVYFTFQKDGAEQTLQWGPTNLLDANRGCNEGSGSICYEFAENELLNFFKNSMPEDGSIYTYDRADSCAPASNLDLLPQSLCFEVTAVDEFLGNYIQVNDPRYTDLTSAKPEYTNLSGNVAVAGVFGSYSTDKRYAIMRECSEALLGLNGTALPLGCEW